MRYAWHSLRSNARRRKRDWERKHGRPTGRFDIELTFEQFCNFCYATKLLVGRGRSLDSWHIDRIDVNKGSSIDNIQVLTNHENIRKYLDYDYLEDKGRYIQVTKTQTNESCPF